MLTFQNFDLHTWLKSIFDKVESKPQTQEALNDQLLKLYFMANYFGLYDAAEYLKNNLELINRKEGL
jgi:hypothetical protein